MARAPSRTPPETDTSANGAAHPADAGRDDAPPGFPVQLTMKEIALLTGVSAQTIRRFFKEPAHLSERMHRRLKAVLGEMGLATIARAPQAAGDDRETARPPAPASATGACVAEVSPACGPHEMAASTDDAPSSPPPEPATPPLAAGLDCAESPPSQARQAPRPGAPLTIAEIADLAGVSTKTVSRYLNQSPLLSDTMRGRIEEVIARTGFVPNAQARALALRRNFLVALIQDGRAGEIAQAVEAGMLEAMKESELALVLHRLDTAPAERDANLRTFLLRHHPCGVVLLPPLSEEEAIARCCAQAGTTAIRLGKVPGNAGLAADDRAAMASLVHWLVASGHTRIALVGGPESSLSARERELGYLDAMADHGLDRGPALIEPGDNSLASGLAAGRVLLELSPRPSAIIACNDAMAAGLLQAASEAAVPVPDTLSVIGFDDTPLATMTCPPLTSVHVPWRALGAEAIRQIRESFTPPSVAVSDPAPAFEARLVERGSVQALTRALVSDAGLEGKSARRTSGFDHASSPFAPAIETFAALPKFPE